uniref:PC-esterase domain-containing protein 1A-like n=1 Tax=Crassostrea virginica TaxID=6565 RepID=A0A8B8E7W8_CRAVI|nr:PC-esterase domain-containing protein 1A-like [Crassostrea virginica]XP_022335765.1 PC-esterase domain-containing protein 1A-like [Crassostrea virginica]
MVVTVDVFLKEDLLKLLKNRFIVIIGDSNQRAIYKDLVLLLQRNDYISNRQLRTKGEVCFENDKLIEGGRLSNMNNGTGYREVRQFQTDCYLLRFYFVTRCYGTYMESILSDLSGELQPDVVIINSCLWDISRYGSNSVEEYKENLNTLFDRFKEKLPEDTLVIWNTTLPVAKDIRGGFLVPEIDFMKNTLRLDILEANLFAKQIVEAHGFDILDLHYHLRNRLDRRAKDGVHWDQKAHRHITNLLLTHIADAWSEKMPERNKPKSDHNGNIQNTAELSSKASESNKENSETKKTTNVNTTANVNTEKTRKEMETPERTIVINRRTSSNRSSSSSSGRARKSLDPLKPVTMGEKEQLEIFNVVNGNTPNSRRRSFDRLQADLNKVQREILGMVCTPPSSKGQYASRAQREPAYQVNSYQTNSYQTNSYQNNSYQTNSYQTNSYCNTYCSTDNYSNYQNNFVNNLTCDLYQTQYQSAAAYGHCYNQNMNNIQNNYMNNYQTGTGAFQWQPYAQDNYQGANRVWSSRTHYKPSQSHYRMSHNY